MSSFFIAAPSRSSPAAIRLAALLALAWLAAAAQLLWHFEKQRLASSRQLVHFATDDLPSPPSAAAGVAKILYFLDRDCSCNAAALAEIARLRRVAVLPEAQFAVDAAGAAALGGNVQALSAAERAGWSGRVPAAPAVALWSASGNLVYFGPIAVNAGCGDGVSYLQNALRTMRKDSSALFAPWDVVTCAC